MEGSYTNKEIIEKFIRPELDEMRRAIESIEKQMREGTPWGRTEVERVSNLFQTVNGRLDNFIREALTPERITAMIDAALKKNQALGITTRERRLRYALGFAAVLGTLMSLITFVYVYTHGGPH